MIMLSTVLLLALLGQTCATGACAPSPAAAAYAPVYPAILYRPIASPAAAAAPQPLGYGHADPRRPARFYWTGRPGRRPR
jgi:hypothetical protein